ncbi:MAG: RDD family protein [Pseudomonadota bacterium]
MFAVFADSPEAKALRESRAGAARLFTDFAVRVFVLGLDVFLVLIAANLITTEVAARSSFATDDIRALTLLLLPAYFAASWGSPLRATPTQLLFGMRVVDVGGNRLSPIKASLRAITLLAIIAASLSWYDIFNRSWVGLVAVTGCAAALLAALTPNRQALHDFVAGSIVVNKRAIKSDEDWQRVADIAGHNTPAAKRAKRPTVVRMVTESLAMCAAVLVLVNMITMNHDRNLRAGVAYAISETKALRAAVAEFHLDEDRWPGPEDELGVERRGDYPDGGYYELGNDGVVRISFTRSSELMRGHLALTPADRQRDFECLMKGDINARYLPSTCRPD